ncbi:unnamed protein product, partial [Rotaria socialis]
MPPSALVCWPFDIDLMIHLNLTVYYYIYICRAEVTLFAEVTTSTDTIVEVITSTIIFAEVITSAMQVAEVKLRQ